MIPEVYQGGQRAIASYDYTEIAEGSGIVAFNGFYIELIGSGAFALSKNSGIVSAAIERSDTTQNYDTSAFNLPKIIQGMAFITFSEAVVGGVNCSWQVAVQKVSGGVATTIGSAESQYTTAALGPRSCCINISLPQTHFRKGDILRLNFVANTAGQPWLGCDPINRSGTHITPASSFPTTLIAYIPFRINL